MSATTAQHLERQLEWTAPTGRRLVPGTTFRHRRGRPSEPDALPAAYGGAWRFLAYVDDGAGGHVEAVAVNGPRSIRAFDPADVYGVSNTKGGAR